MIRGLDRVLRRKSRTRAGFFRFGSAVVLLLGSGLLCPLAAAAREAATGADDPPNVVLGERLFSDERFVHPSSPIRMSCRSCHMVDENRQGIRAYTDFLSRSWVPYRAEDRAVVALRNSPTLLNVGDMERLHHDGEFRTLTDLVVGTLQGRNMGWMKGEEEQALAYVTDTVLNDAGDGSGPHSAYVERFRSVYGIDLRGLSRADVLAAVARAIGDYLLSLESERDAPYDEFIAANGLPSGPAAGESARAFGDRALAEIDALRASGGLKWVDKFGEQELKGFEVFLRSRGAESTGNCVTCHAPPGFTDHAFHNLGISQLEYDRIFGSGSFMALEIPGAASARRPDPRFLAIASFQRPGQTDLGYWNYAEAEPGADDRGLDRWIAAMKTPTLRNLAFTEPYMHNGGYRTVDAALEALIEVSDLERELKLRSGDAALRDIHLGEEDLAPLRAFLASLNEDYE